MNYFWGVILIQIELACLWAVALIYAEHILDIPLVILPHH